MADIVDSYSEANVNAETNIIPSSGQICAKGQSFTCGGDYVLDSVKFVGRKNTVVGGGLVYAKIYSHSGTYGTSSVPDTLLATSDGADSAGWTTSSALREFTFSGADRIDLSAGYYVVTYEAPNANMFDFVRVSIDTSSPTHDGNSINKAFATGVWSADNTDDVAFYVYGVAPSAAGGAIMLLGVG